MSVFEYANILWSILFSLALAHMLSSAAALIQAGDRVRWSALHGVWWLSVLVCVIGNWISLWDLRTLTAWTTGYVLLLLFATFLQYLACFLVSPEKPGAGKIDLNAFHEEQGTRYLIGFTLMQGIAIPLNLVTAQMYGVTTWGVQNLAQGPAAALTFAAIFLRGRTMQWVLAVSVLALSAFYLFGLQSTIQ